MKPRPYQDEAKRETRLALRSGRSTLVVMPTGCGKTVFFASLIALSRVLCQRNLVTLRTAGAAFLAGIFSAKKSRAFLRAFAFSSGLAQTLSSVSVTGDGGRLRVGPPPLPVLRLRRATSAGSVGVIAFRRSRVFRGGIELPEGAGRMPLDVLLGRPLETGVLRGVGALRGGAAGREIPPRAPPPPPRHWAAAVVVVRAGVRMSKTVDHRVEEETVRAVRFMGLSFAVEFCTDSGVEPVNEGVRMLAVHSML